MYEPVYHVDAFTHEPFKGNPAAVCLLNEPRGETWMQCVAREMNLSETAFLVRGKESIQLRWFTPGTEVELCGHATLASAHVLWEIGVVPPEQTIRFSTKSGNLLAEKRGREVAIDLPLLAEEASQAPPGLADALGAIPTYSARSRFDLLVELETVEQVRGLRPDMRKLLEIPVRGLIVTARASGGTYHFVSRFFAPRAGVDEDPVTGSAHCVLASYWGRKLGRAEMHGYQASARGGLVGVTVKGDRVELRGGAIITARGELLV
jgi:PhzF family phenazine biosynthesis protein